MKYYIEIRLQPDEDIPHNQLMNALFARLYRSLETTGKKRIGISFPKHDNEKTTMSRNVRLHGNE